MKKRSRYLVEFVAVAIGATLAASSTFAQSVDTARIEAGGQNDWLTYHGSYKSYHYSPLAQINASNVGNLGVAWIHIPGRSTRGLQSMPLVADGVLYYTGSYSRIFALNGATGEVIWSYFPELDEALIARQTHSPYNRGLALGDGKVYVGTMDGRLIALDMKTGKSLWDTKLIDSQKLTVGFTGAPLYVKGTVIIGAQGGEWPGRGPIFAVDAATGKKKWEFLTVAGTDEAMKTWGNDSWRTGGGGGWMPGTYDSETNTIWWGTANPAPLYDWSGADYKTQGARPGDNLYTTSVIAPRSGYRQAEILSSGAAARRLGLRQRGRRVRDARTRRPEARGASQQERLRLRLRPQSRREECLAARSEHQLRQGHRSQDRRVDRPPRLLRGQGQATAAVPVYCRRRQLERGFVQPEDRPLLQDRPGMVHDARGREDDAGDRAAGPAQHRRRLQDGASSERRDLWPSRRARPGDRG